MLSKAKKYIIFIFYPRSNIQGSPWDIYVTNFRSFTNWNIVEVTSLMINRTIQKVYDLLNFFPLFLPKAADCREGLLASIHRTPLNLKILKAVGEVRGVKTMCLTSGDG